MFKYTTCLVINRKMAKKNILISFLALFVLFSFVQLASASTTVSTCVGFLNTAGETYVLNQSISTAGRCLAINASGVTLNLNGFSVTNTLTTQDVISVLQDRVTIKNGYVHGGSTGIDIQYDSNNAGPSFITVRNVTIAVGIDSTSFGISAYTNNSLIEDVVIKDVREGMRVIGSGTLLQGKNNIFRNVLISNVSLGVRLTSGVNNYFENLRATNLTGTGPANTNLYLSYVVSRPIANNTFRDFQADLSQPGIVLFLQTSSATTVHNLNNSFINATYTGEQYIFGVGTMPFTFELKRQWYFETQVNWSDTHRPVYRALVSVTNSSTDFFSIFTNVRGKTTPQVLTEYVRILNRTSDTIIFASNYTLNVTHLRAKPYSTTFNLSTNLVQQVNLEKKIPHCNHSLEWQSIEVEPVEYNSPRRL